MFRHGGFRCVGIAGFEGGSAFDGDAC
ncbi:uncharacterized protein METZ01_LOCUS419814 [marine metagenome]|uniref:Uncharacterized protein n=1 Tax=marine metagenome TaxID=408172 RepID=A0A382X7V2_9ZZZZ